MLRELVKLRENLFSFLMQNMKLLDLLLLMIMNFEVPVASTGYVDLKTQRDERVKGFLE